MLVEPVRIWGFYPNKSVSENFLEYLDRFGWEKVPRVPIFRIPLIEGVKIEHDYFLLDGNQRLNAATMRRELLPTILYESDEIIDPIKDGLASSRNLSHPRRFDILVYMYSRRSH